MTAPGPDTDDTVRVRPKPKQPLVRIRATLIAGAALIIILAATGAAWSLLDTSPKIPIDTESETQINATQPCTTTVSHLTADPNIIVIDFPSLTTQGLTLNRIAALIEKAHLPRNRVLTDVELNEAIYNCGDTIESYYYGHDYKAADLAKFFRLATAENITLNQHELWLKSLLKQLGWLKPGATGAIITLPAATPPITPRMRAVILHHEISHGAFYTIPQYAQYAKDFWNSLTQTDRTNFTNFLGSEGYDTSNTTLMLNETQAYLIFTRDPLFFNASVVNMTPAQIETLRTGYIANIPIPWLQPMANAPLPISSQKSATCPAAR